MGARSHQLEINATKSMTVAMNFCVHLDLRRGCKEDYRKWEKSRQGSL